MLSDLLYWWLGNRRKTKDTLREREKKKEAEDKTKDKAASGDNQETFEYITDPYYKLLIVFPFWIALVAWTGAGLLMLLFFAGWMGWVSNLHMLRIFETSAFLSLLGSPFFLVSYTVLQKYWVTIPDPNEGARQAFTKKTRFLRNGAVIIPWLGIKLWILPGVLRLIHSADKGGTGRSVETWIRQREGGTDRQFIKLQINYRLDVHNYPRRIFQAFLDQFMEFRLERMKGDSWLSKMQTATNGTMIAIDKEIIDRLAAMADAILADVVIENLIDDREAINKKFTEEAQNKFLEEFGVEVLSVSIEDVQDVRPEGGWITEKSRASQAQQTSKADQIAANANRDAEVVEAEAFRVGEEAKLAAQEAVATREVQTTEARIRAAAKIAELNLQEVKASLDLLKTSENSEQRVFAAAMLDKLSKLDTTQMITVWNGAKEVMQAAASSMHPPHTVVQGIGAPGEFRNVHPQEILFSWLGQVFGIPAPSGTPLPHTPPTTPGTTTPSTP